MRRLIVSVALGALCLLGVVAAACSKPSADGASATAAIQETFTAYRSALQSSNGKVAANAVTRSTIDRYGEYRDLALSGAPTTVKALPMIDRMIVLTVRRRVDAETIRSMDGRALLAHGVKQGWISQTAVARVELGRIFVGGDTATAEALADGRRFAQFKFAREGERWKLDLTKVMAATEPGLKALAEKQGLSENQLLFRLVAGTGGPPVTEAIWQPLE